MVHTWLGRTPVWLGRGHFVHLLFSLVQTWAVPRGRPVWVHSADEGRRHAGQWESWLGWGLGWPAWEVERGSSGCLIPCSRPPIPVPGGGVLVIESLLDADGRGPLTTQLYSLNMLVQTEGRERTPAQYLGLLAAAGFQDFQCRRTGGIYDAILARR